MNKAIFLGFLFVLIVLVLLPGFSKSRTVCSSPSQNPSCPSDCLNSGISCSQQSAGSQTPTVVGTDLNCVKTINAGCGFSLNLQLSIPNTCPSSFSSTGNSNCGFLSFLLGGTNNCSNYIDAGCLSNDSASCPAGYQIANSTTCSLQGTPVSLYQECCDIPNSPQTFSIHNVTCSSTSGTNYDYSCVGSAQNCTLSDSNAVNCQSGYECNANSASQSDDCIAMPYTITGVVVSPSSISVSPGCYQFRANQTTSINSQIPATGVLWGSNDSSINVSSNGLACIPSNYSGSFLVTASVTPWLGLASVNVMNITNFSVAPSTVRALVGSDVYFQSGGVSPASGKRVGVFSSWSVSTGYGYFESSMDGQVSYYSASGSGVLFNVGQTPGNYSINVNYGFLNSTVNISVLSYSQYTPPPQGVPPILKIYPPNATIPSGQTQQLFITATDINGIFLNANNVSWSVANNTVASVDSNGLVTGLNPGLTMLNASGGGSSAVAILSVSECSLGNIGQSNTATINGVSCVVKSTCIPTGFGYTGWSVGTPADACCGVFFNGTATPGCCPAGFETQDPSCSCTSGQTLGPVFRNGCWGNLNCGSDNLFDVFTGSNECNSVQTNKLSGVLCAFTNYKSNYKSYEYGCLSLTSSTLPTSCYLMFNPQTLSIGQNFSIYNYTYNLFDISTTGAGVMLNIYNSSSLITTSLIGNGVTAVLPTANVSISSIASDYSSAILNFSYLNCTFSSIPVVPKTELFLIQLQTPENGGTTTISQPDFAFNVTGPDATYSCALYVDGSVYGSNSSVYNNTQTIITSNNPISSGDHNYYINCSGNTFSVINNSQTYSFTQNAPQISIILSNPTNYGVLWTQPGFTKNWPVIFNFTAQGPDSSYNCFLNIDGVLYSISAINNTQILASEDLDNGTHIYNVSCSNGGLISISKTYTFYLKNPNLLINLIYPINGQTVSTYYNTITFNFTTNC
ncbi:MAG: Ig-like domain-containing protein [Candidatus Marsarchaeota archaeon]|nr:Ig-like domain-containing protein [Candidatus Marsarchaeota archaeon]